MIEDCFMCCTKGQGGEDEFYPGMNWKVLTRFEFYLFIFGCTSEFVGS